MTTGKPPQLPQKTRFGQPDDPREAAQKPAPAPDFQRTLYGNPHAAPASGSARPPASAVPPRLPPSQPFQPPPLPPRSQPAPVQVQPPATEPSSRPVDMNRTQYGAKPELDAAARQARAVVAAAAAAPSQPAPHQQATQYSPRPGIGASGAAAAAGSLRPNQTVVLKDAPQPSAAGSSRPAAEPAPARRPEPEAASSRPMAWAPAPAPAQPAPVSPAGTSAQPSAAANSAQPSVVAAPVQSSVVKPGEQFVSTEPDRERDSKRPQASMPQPGVPSVRLMPPSSASLPPSAAPNPMQATRLVTFEGGALPASSTASGAPSALSASPQLSLDANEINARKGATATTSVKRWPALSLIAIAVLAFGGVIAVRAPGLLPPPLIPYAALLSSQVERFFPGSVVSPPAANPQTEPAAPAPVLPPEQPAAAPGTDPQAQQPMAAPDVAPQQAPEAPAAQAPVAASQATAPTVAAAAAPVIGAVPAALHGGAAELEKQAIELLLANDYAAARAVYERLRAAEPTRPEYAVMLELLIREITPTCGGEGQALCAQ